MGIWHAIEVRIAALQVVADLRFVRTVAGVRSPIATPAASALPMQVETAGRLTPIRRDR